MKRKEFLHIDIKTKKDKRAFFQHEYFGAGTVPYTKGIYSTMYLKNPILVTKSFKYDADYIPIYVSDTNSAEGIVTTLLEAYKYVQNQSLQKNNLHDALSKIVFVQKAENKMFDEIAKLKVIRTIWAKIAMKFQPQKQELLAAKMAYQTKTDSLLEIMTAVFCGVQHLILSKNTTFSEEEITCFLQEETFITKSVDPWGGATTLEEKTNVLIKETWQELLKNNCF